MTVSADLSQHFAENTLLDDSYRVFPHSTVFCYSIFGMPHGYLWRQTFRHSGAKILL